MIRGGGDLAFASDDQRLGHQRADVVRLLAGARDVQTFERLVIAHHVGCLAMSDPPDDFSFIEIDGGDRSIRGLDQRQAVDVHRNITAASPFFRGLRRIGARVFARASHDLHFFSRGPGDVVDIGDFLRRRNEPDRFKTSVACIGVDDVRLRIVRPARPVGAAGSGPERERAERAVAPAHNGWRIDGAQVVFRGNGLRTLAKRGREIDQIVDGDAITAVSRRLRGNRLRRGVPLAGHVADFDGPLWDGPNGFSGHAIENVEEALLAGLRHGLHWLTIHCDVCKNGRGGDVHVPQRVVHQLEVPLAFAGFQIDADEAFTKEIVSRPVSAVEIAGR